MKNLLFLFAFLTTCQWASAQMTTWTWEVNAVQFQAPSNFKVSKNNGDIFSAGNANLNLTIYSEKGANHTYEKMTGVISKWATNNNLSYDSEPAFMEDLNRYWGCYIDGYASNGNPTTVMLLVDPDFPEIGMYVWLQYQDGYLDTAVEILSSFVPN